MKCEKLLEIDLAGIYVPLQECLTIKPGSIPVEILDEMDRRNYDYIPVVDNKCVYGLAKKSYLREICTNKGILSDKDSKIENKSIFWEIKYPYISLPSLLKKMSQEEAILVVQADEIESYPVNNFLGLITLSDLNRHEIRFAFYRLIITLEERLSLFVTRYFVDDSTWIKKLNENEQIRILGYREFSKQRNMETKLIEATTFTNLVDIINKTKEIIELLKYPSRNSFKKQTGRLPILRNSTMHIVRPLIDKQSDITGLIETIEFICDFIERIK